MPNRWPSLGTLLGSVALRYRTGAGTRAPTRQPQALGGRIGTLFSTARLPPKDEARTTRRDWRAARVEAVLFLSSEPITSRKIGQLASLADGTEARTLIRQLNRWYDETGCAFQIQEVAGGFQLLTRVQFGSWLRRLHQAPLQTRLSSPAMETLAVVAYRQPVPRAEIEAIRGVQCGEMLRQLMERDLVRIIGRSEDLGRPFLYGTSKRFLRMFGLRNLDELPRADWLQRGAPSAAPAASARA